jgi:hypothetical protein
MFCKRNISIIGSVFLILVSACNLQWGPAMIRGTNQDPTAAIQTQVAEIVASTGVAQTAFANVMAATQAAMTTDTPEFTFTPSLTPTPTFTFTPAVPMVTVSLQTNCRSGPGTAYDILGVLNAGQTAEVVGRSAASDNWIIKLPSNPTITCWLWGFYAIVVGNTSGLPVIIPPPTPTPVASFNVAYSSTEACPFVFYAIKFLITNNGSVTWESNRVSATDLVTTEYRDIWWDDFRNYNDIGCALISADTNLEPGEVGYTSSLAFSANPAGHNITATIRVCSLDGMAGTCLDKTVSFTP